jgi:dipeptidyl aminopeptidase/acylaminoacyl peptidase
MPRTACVPRLLACLIFCGQALPLLAGPGARAAPAAPPPEAFGTIPVESDVVLSPDGHWLAWLDHKEAKPRVIMFDAIARKLQRVLAVPERTKLRYLVWSDNETLLIVLSETKESATGAEVSREYFRTIAHDVSGGVGRMLPSNRLGSGGAGGSVLGNRASGTPESGPPLADLVATRTTKPNTVIMETFGKCHAVIANCLLEVNTRTGLATVIKVGGEHTTAWVVDREGNPVAREDWDYQHHAYRLYSLAGDALKEILRKDDSERPNLVGLLADGSAVVVLATNGGNHQAAWALPLDGSPLKLLAEDPNADISNVYTDSYTGAIIGVYANGLAASTHWLDPKLQQRHAVLQRSFPGRQVHVYGWTADGTKTLALVQTPSIAPVYYLIDFNTHHADIVAEEYPALTGVTLGEVKEITYKARDGTQIPAFLTTPADKQTAPIPLVVLPHGGPQARDYFTFDWLVQFLASRGYAVLQPQFRGSTGFGDAFREAGYRQWGGLMQDDVTDGVRAMIDQGVADPHRICIVGASYGGYAALAGAAFTPDLYACAASISGVSDLPALMREQVPWWGGWGGSQSTALSDWRLRIGEPNDPNLAGKSPINSVNTIKVPILIIYGTGDGVVPNAQSEKMARALKAAGKSVAVATLPGEDHWLSRTDTRTQVLAELDRFLREHL